MSGCKHNIMYKSSFTVFFRRLSLGLIILVSACNSQGNGDKYKEHAQETGAETQNINNSDRDATYDTLADKNNPTYNNPDTNMMTRKLQPQDSSAVHKGGRR